MGPRLARARFEAVLCGAWTYVAAPFTLAFFAFLGVIADSPGRLLTAGLETGVPLAAGLIAASMLAGEPSLELQLTIPSGVRPAILLRLGAVFAWSSAVCVVTWLVAYQLGVFGDWLPAGGPALAQLTWLAPLAAFTVIGALLAVAFRSRALASGAVMIFWVAGHAFRSDFESQALLRAWYPFLTTYAAGASDWAATRLTLLGLAAVALVALAAWLGAGEWLLSGEDR